MASSNLLRTDLPGENQELVKLQVVVAQTARNRRTAREILAHERANNIPLEPLLMVHDIVRNAQALGDIPGVIDVVHGTAASLHLLGHPLATGEPALVPKLHCQPDQVVTLV